MAVTTTRQKAIPAVTPAQLAGYFQAKLAAELGPHNVKRLQMQAPGSAVLLDVRSQEGFDAGHIPGAVHIPFEELPARARELPKSKDIIAYCWDTTCTLSTKAAYVLARQGFRAREMIGGMTEWQRAGFPIEK